MPDNKKTDKPTAIRQAAKGKGLPSPEDAIGRRIREKREELHLNVSQLSERTKKLRGNDKGLSRAVIAGYENGEYKPGTSELRILCDALETSPNWLIYGNESIAQQRAVIQRALATEHPELAMAKLLYIITSLSEDEFESIATLLLSLAKNDKALKAALLDDATVMGRMIVASHTLESSPQWSAAIAGLNKESTPKAKALSKRRSLEMGRKKIG